ncbi:MAG: acetylglutamate kinase [Acidobacteria bacterium]|nr:acetylglutamate kinase [Acidobacteriota bacterium]
MRITIKLGGSILEDADIRGRLLDEIAAIALQKHEIILVHGGGKSLNRRLQQLQMEARFIDGLRVTDEATLGVAVMVLAGEVNKKLVAELGRPGVAALGLCGADAQAVCCAPVAGMPGYPDGIGFVGKPTKVNRDFFELLLGAGITPVVSSIAIRPGEAAGEKARFYNINADQMASACAAETGCEALVYLTDVPGVMDANEKVINALNKADILELRARGAISGGMLPKTAACLEAIDTGVVAVYILPGADRNILTDFITGNSTKGTKIYEN